VSWTQLLAKREVNAHLTSRQELNNIRALIARDLADASIAVLSADRRFATAYNAALQAGTIAVACSGYRVTARAGHHAVTFEAAQLALGTSATTLTDYFDACRRKRNTIDYQNISVATDTEAKELVKKANEFLRLVERWVQLNHPSFVP
jgi:uncharacterized protein (UPF0332 family)